MIPYLYRRKTRGAVLMTLLALALGLRLRWTPALLEQAEKQAEGLLGGRGIFGAALLLETGQLPPRQPDPGHRAHGETQAPPESKPKPTQTTAPSETPPESQAETEPESISTEPEPISKDPEAAPAAEMEAPAPFTPEEAEAIKLRGSCSYQVDKTDLLLRPLEWPRLEGPRVLIIHSHSCESYTQCEGHSYVPDANFRTLDLENNVVAVGDALTEELEALGVEVIHDRTYNDYPHYNSSYANARQKILDHLQACPSITMVIDLHRDALEDPVRETAEVGGQVLAPLMLVVGTDEGGLSHPHWAANLSCGLKLQALANRDQPGLFKSLSFRKERFNGDLTPGSLIVEVGSTENTLPEAVASMPYLARYVAELLQTP